MRRSATASSYKGAGLISPLQWEGMICLVKVVLEDEKYVDTQ